MYPRLNHSNYIYSIMQFFLSIMLLIQICNTCLAKTGFLHINYYLLPKILGDTRTKKKYVNTWLIFCVLSLPTTKCSKTIFFLVISIILSSIVPLVMSLKIITYNIGRVLQNNMSSTIKSALLLSKP